MKRLQVWGRSRIARLLAPLLLVVGMTAGGVAATAAPAAAAGLSYVWQTDANGWVAIYAAPNVNTIPHQWSKSGTKFKMNCWLDNAGERWFWGQIYDTGYWGNVRAVQVRNQISVKPC